MYGSLGDPLHLVEHPQVVRQTPVRIEVTEPGGDGRHESRLPAGGLQHPIMAGPYSRGRQEGADRLRREEGTTGFPLGRGVERRRLEKAGVDVRYRLLEGHVHPSFAFTRITRSAAAYQRDAIAALATALHA